MSAFLWPTDDGWPYPDQEAGLVGRHEWTEADDDLLNLQLAPPHLFDDLDPLERHVVTSRFGLGGAPVRTMKQLREELGVPRDELKLVLGSALGKLRTHLTA